MPLKDVTVNSVRSSRWLLFGAVSVSADYLHEHRVSLTGPRRPTAAGDVVSWHDRGPNASSKCWEVVVAFSGDGGDSFTDAHKVSTKASCPAAGANGWTAERWPFWR